MTIQEFINDFNYMLQGAIGSIDINNPDEMLYYKEAVASMMKDNCDKVVEFEVINEKGQIKLTGGQNEG